MKELLKRLGRIEGTAYFDRALGFSIVMSDGIKETVRFTDIGIYPAHLCFLVDQGFTAFQTKVVMRSQDIRRVLPQFRGKYIEVTIEKKEKIKNSNGVDFLYKGSFSNYMLNAAKEGEEFEIFGVTKNENFVYDENSTRNYLGIAASSGIVPIMCHLRYIVDMNLKRDVVIIYSNRYRPDNIIYRKELESIQSMADNLKYPNFKIKIVNIITRNEDPEWKGRVSRMDSELIRDVVDDLKNRTCFVCGGGKFIQDISKQLTGLGVADDDIRIDMWEKIDSK